METGSRLRRLKAENTYHTKNINVIKSAFLFGANAGGKSNLLEAIILLRYIILHPTEDSTEQFPWEPFVGNDKPTVFSITFLKNNKKFMYFLEYTDKMVCSELLKVDDRVIFKRIQGQVEGPDKVLEENIKTLRNNQLLLYWAQDKNVLEAIEAYSWFKNDIIDLTERLSSERMLNREDSKIFADKEFKEKFLAVLKAADFNISDYILSENTEVKEKIEKFLSTQEDMPEGIKKVILKSQVYVTELQLKHSFDIMSPYFPLRRESLGTQRFVQLLIHIMPELTSNKVLLIDEFDQSFHFEMIKVLVNLMNKWNANNQFIVTTHQFNVMDLKLRPDQIYFVEKNVEGISEMYSLFDFDNVALMRSDYDYKKRYLKGLFGGMQIVNFAALDSIFAENTIRGQYNEEEK